MHNLTRCVCVQKKKAYTNIYLCERCKYFKWFDVSPIVVDCNYDKNRPFEPVADHKAGVVTHSLMANMINVKNYTE